jgi:septal ring factor EnvC (AmiA/AmiB activator)
MMRAPGVHPDTLLRVAILALSILTLVAPAALAEEEDEAPGNETELEQLRGAIEETRERVGEHEREERGLLERLEEVDRSLTTLSADVVTAEREAAESRAAVAALGPRLAEVRAELDRTQRAMSKRVVALYKAGEVSAVRALFAATSLPELLSRVSVLERLLEYDSALVTRFTHDHASLLEVERQAREAGVRRDEAVRVLSERSEALEREQAEKRDLLARVRTDRTNERALLVELERAARALEETLASLGERAPGSGAALDGSGFAERRGSLRAPVDGRINEHFGRVVDSEYQTEIFRKGARFDARVGESVWAVARGEVRFAGWFRGYGQIVIVDHGDGYFTVSGHLAEIFVEVGDGVGEGDTLGTVGETGSLTGPALYFEIRAGGEPMDPADWLASGAQRAGR